MSEDLLNKIMDSLLVSLAVKLDCSDTFILRLLYYQKTHSIAILVRLIFYIRQSAS